MGNHSPHYVTMSNLQFKLNSYSLPANKLKQISQVFPLQKLIIADEKKSINSDEMKIKTTIPM